jgi:hypothetical protein
MSCEHLVCAQCSGPVTEGRCSVCRASRDHVHHQYGSSATALVLTLMVLLVALATVAEQFGG